MIKSTLQTSVCVVCKDDARLAQARQFADSHAYPLLAEKNDQYELQLVFNDDLVELFDSQLATGIHVDFVQGALAHRQQFGGGRGQPIARAVGLKRGNTPTVLDITAGLARDAYVLACLGCRVTLVEQSPILALLISDAIERGLSVEDSARVLRGHFGLVNQDAVEYMKHLDSAHRPDIVYMDPMYPHRKKSALVKKDMQILQHLLGEDDSAEALLEAALSTASKRVVVKRPIHAGHVGKHKPDTSINSKKTRYDIYLMR